MNYASNQMHKLLKGWILNYLYNFSGNFISLHDEKVRIQEMFVVIFIFFFPKIISVAQFSLLLLLFSHSVVSNSL